MGFPRNPFSKILPFFLTILILTPHSQSATDYTSLVYKGCAKQPLSDPTNAYPQALSSLFATLISQSSKSKFYKTTTQTPSITGLFQCRGDLSNLDCYNCVSKLPTLINKLCGKVVSARVQLLGCYMLYEGAGFAQISGMEMLFKSCSRANANGAGFEEKRDTALNSLENGMSGNGGFFATSFGDVYVLGQCEGDVGASDCVECVKSGVQRAQVECGSSIGGQIYLHKCFIGYSYYPNGVPKRSSPGSYSSPSSGYCFFSLWLCSILLCVCFSFFAKIM
ncbi:cysteine-rich repeat secretory protein 11 [Phtheirospermum japonicum]|uniref:Cysteine-rich repeat secretory protein 11 n=1 Tax=Phtheirospermum japonicum TaxID=374723 RepID=A0A830BF67_9LAMI|nr:cysteine-rich repeat secretory protein 11 [Phtheirospermum japonicum]